MTFVAGFYSFNLNISNTSDNFYSRERIKTALHPEETPQHLVARVLAYALNCQHGVKFGAGLFDKNEPAIYRKGILGDFEVCIDVGCPTLDNLNLTLRSKELSTYRIYFFESEDVSHFCHHLRGSKTNWVEQIEFLHFELEFLQTISNYIASSNVMEISVIDNFIYLTIADRDLQSEIKPVDIWQEFQTSINNKESTPAA